MNRHILSRNRQRDFCRFKPSFIFTRTQCTYTDLTSFPSIPMEAHVIQLLSRMHEHCAYMIGYQYLFL